MTAFAACSSPVAKPLCRIRASFGIAAFVVVSLAANGTAFGWGHDLPPDSQGNPGFIHDTTSTDFLGRWAWADEQDESNTDAPKSAPAFLDIVACGHEFCGIEVLKTGTCGRVILRFHDQGVSHSIDIGDGSFDRYSGHLAWTGKYSEYAVSTDVDGPAHARPKANGPKRLDIEGYPTDPSARWERIYPFDLSFAYSGSATCTLPSS